MKPLHIIPAVALALASCGDFLEMEPLNEIVLENYWTEKADVQSVVYSCYSGLTKTDCITRMFVWGEVRSDNVQAGASVPEALRLVTQEELMSNSPWTQWVDFYQVINRCNTVIKYAPIVAAKDPNYTDGDMRAHIAEATALRSLCYFYLIRAFRDVPYVTTPSSDDSDIDTHYRVPATKFADVMDSLVMSLESVRDYAIKVYPENQEDFNCARITKTGIDAMLCELYLWKNDYAKCMETADRIIDFKLKRYEEMKEEEGAELDIELFADRYPLLPEQPSGNYAGNTYEAIFGDGYSFESLFELGFEREKGNNNEMVGNYFGKSGSTQGQLFANYNMADNLNTSDKYNVEKLYSYDDCRFWENIYEPSEKTFVIRKYVNQLCTIEIGSPARPDAKVSSSMRSALDANWIIYRLTDVMLMKAEAAVELQAEQGGDSLLAVAFELVKAVNRRARNLSEGEAKNLQLADFNTTSQMRELVMDERRRELMFEGKRWFDLLRYSLRWNDNTLLINQVCTKKLDKQSAVQVKLRTQDALFWPINKTELIVNPHLKQNPAYQSDEDKAEAK